MIRACEERDGLRERIEHFEAHLEVWRQECERAGRSDGMGRAPKTHQWLALILAAWKADGLRAPDEMDYWHRQLSFVTLVLRLVANARTAQNPHCSSAGPALADFERCLQSDATTYTSLWRACGGDDVLKAEALRDIRRRLAAFYEEADVERWLTSPHLLLDGQTAMAYLDAGRVQDVLALIEHLETGAFV